MAIEALLGALAGRPAVGSFSNNRNNPGLPVSTTHVLSSGVAGTMAANRSGLQWSTIRNLVMAWILTLPVSIALAAALFWIFRHAF